MLTTATLEKTLSLLDEGYTFASITEETGITLEDVEAVHVAWFTGTSEQLFRELELAGVLELAAAKLCSGQGWDEGTTGDIPVATDVFLRHLEPFALQSLRRAIEQGLVPSGLNISGDDEPIVILRFTRPLAGETLDRTS
jgi:hypothetical protein